MIFVIDILLLYNLAMQLEALKFTFFGELVFESNDIEVGWDGNYKNKILQDTYFYKIEFNKNGKLITQTGKFVLIK